MNDDVGEWCFNRKMCAQTFWVVPVATFEHESA